MIRLEECNERLRAIPFTLDSVTVVLQLSLLNPKRFDLTGIEPLGFHFHLYPSTEKKVAVLLRRFTDNDIELYILDSIRQSRAYKLALGYVEMYFRHDAIRLRGIATLNSALIEAGGMILSRSQLQTMTALELIDLITSNNISFKYERPPA